MNQAVRQITLNEPYEVEYWTSTLQLSEDDLRLAVAQVGPNETDVRTFLGRQLPS